MSTNRALKRFDGQVSHLLATATTAIPRPALPVAAVTILEAARPVIVSPRGSAQPSFVRTLHLLIM